MRIKIVREIVTQAVLAERERCAKVAMSTHPPLEYNLQRTGAWCDAQVKIAEIIKAANPPEIRVLRPETVVADPSVLGPGVIVAGQALVGDQIVDRKSLGA